MSAAFSRLIKEPVFQFLILGGGLFAAYSAFAPPEAPPPEEIFVSAARIESLSANFERTWRRPPTGQELGGLIEDYIAEEILYREALKLGLDDNDLIVRRRMRQKMELLLADALSAAPASEAELRAHFEAEKDSYRQADGVSFQQVFLGERSEGAAPEWAELAQRLNDDTAVDLASVGSPSLLPLGMTSATQTDIARLFGEVFAAAATASEPGVWSGPIESAYGWHLLYVNETNSGPEPVFEDVRAEVARDVAHARGREARVELIDRLREGYAISVEEPER